MTKLDEEIRYALNQRVRESLKKQGARVSDKVINDLVDHNMTILAEKLVEEFL